MSPRSRRILVILVLLLLVLLALLLGPCSKSPAPMTKTAEVSAIPAQAPAAAPAPAAPQDAEMLTAATIAVPEKVEAGATFRAQWTGPNNPGDYLTIVRPTAVPVVYENYRETKSGAALELTAPMDAGDWEVRYVTGRSKTVLGKAALKVNSVGATLTADNEAVLGTAVSITWTGPNNPGDFITIVRQGASDDQVGNYTDANKGSPLSVTAPVDAGSGEIRYLSGQGRRVLGRRLITITAPETSLSADEQVMAGKIFAVTWRGPKNAGDYITVVPKGTPDGQYRNYTDTAKGSPLELTAPIESGEAEIRYMTGTNARVLARRSIRIVAAQVTLDAAADVVAGSLISIDWKGPKNPGDYITVVPAATPLGQYGNYTDTSKGSPLNVTAPIRPGPAEIRYMSGQGAKVLARRPITLVAAEITLKAPAQVPTASQIELEWTGPNHAGDYFTIVPQAAKDGALLKMSYTSRGSPLKIETPKETGLYEIRYMSGQQNQVLARRAVEVK